MNKNLIISNLVIYEMLSKRVTQTFKNFSKKCYHVVLFTNIEEIMNH
jgi:hypothetical protein